MSKNYCGLDFGTTNSSLAVITNNQPSVVPLDPFSSTPTILKSLLYINPSHREVVGSEAVSKYIHDLNTLPSAPLRQIVTGRMLKIMVPTSSGTMKADWVPEIIEVDDSGRGRLLQSLKSVLTNQSFFGTDIFGKFYSLEDLIQPTSHPNIPSSPAEFSTPPHLHD